MKKYLCTDKGSRILTGKIPADFPSQNQISDWISVSLVYTTTLQLGVRSVLKADSDCFPLAVWFTLAPKNPLSYFPIDKVFCAQVQTQTKEIPDLRTSVNQAGPTWLTDHPPKIS